MSSLRFLFYLSVVVAAVSPARALERPKNMKCEALVQEPAWRDYVSCFEHPGGDFLRCSMALLTRLPPDKQPLARTLLIDEIAGLLTERKVPFSRHPTEAGVLVLQANSFVATFPRMSALIEKANRMKVAEVSEFVIALEGTENGYAAFYNFEKRRIGVTPLGLYPLMEGDWTFYLTIRHELGHGYLAKSDSHFNTGLGTVGPLAHRPDHTPVFAEMPEGYNFYTSVQETYTYSRQIEASLKALAMGVEKGMLDRVGLLEVLKQIEKGALDINILKKFMPAYRSELDSFRSLLTGEKLGLSYHLNSESAVLLSPEGKMLILGSLGLSAHEKKALSEWVALSPLLTKEQLIAIDLAQLRGTSADFARAVDGIKTKVDFRICVLALIFDEREKMMAEVRDEMASRVLTLSAGGVISDAEMTRFLRKTARRFEFGVKKPAIALHEAACRAAR